VIQTAIARNKHTIKPSSTQVLSLFCQIFRKVADRILLYVGTCVRLRWSGCIVYLEPAELNCLALVLQRSNGIRHSRFNQSIHGPFFSCFQSSCISMLDPSNLSRVPSDSMCPSLSTMIWSARRRRGRRCETTRQVISSRVKIRSHS